MTMTNKSSKPVEPNPAEPPVPTMTNAAILEPPPPRPINAPPEELAADIVALPLTLPDFANDIQPYLLNQGLSARWIFTNPRRYAQARAQGWRNCTKHDLKSDFARLSPFEEEGGTKYVNGDLILMLIDKKRYLGALRYKHQVAATLSHDAVQRTISARRAVSDMGPQVAAINRAREAAGQQPVMQVFTPGGADLALTVLGQAGSKEIDRLGHGQAVDDMGPVSFDITGIAGDSKGK